jgi:hypothetical protein
MTWQETVEDLRNKTAWLALLSIPVEEMPDAAAQVRDVERRLAELRHGWNEQQIQAARDPENDLGPATFPAERTSFGTVQPQVVGRQWRTVTTRTAKRSYNTAAIIHGLVQHGAYQEPTLALMGAIREGAAKVDWRWTQLQALARRLGLPLRTVDHAIPDDGDLDAPWVGESWQESVRQEPVKGDPDA